MKPAPDPFFIQLAEERRLESAASRPNDPELAADWQLRQELQQLDPPALPDAFKRRLARQTGWRHQPPGWLGLAAAIVLALGVGLFHKAEQPAQETAAISEYDLAQLQLALATLHRGLQRSGQVASRELGTSLAQADLSLEPLPHIDTLRRWIQPAESLNPEP
jgi:hypothetical protein